MRLRKQQGQAMIEFTMVLPLLLLLSFGTLEVGLYLQRRVTMGGAAFIAARAAAVQGPRAIGISRQVLQTYAQDSHSQWIAEAAQSARLAAEGRLLRLSVMRDGDTWTGALTGSVELTGGHLAPQAKWKTDYPISQEYVPGGPGGKSFARKPTDIMVDYRARIPWMGQIPNFGPVLDKIPGAGGADIALALNPAEQAAMENPGNRSGSTSPSKMYVTPYAEEKEFQHAKHLADGIEGLERATIGFYTLYVFPKPVPGGGAVVDKSLEAVVKGFAQADQSLNFVKTSDALETAMNGFFGAKGSR